MLPAATRVATAMAEIRIRIRVVDEAVITRLDSHWRSRGSIRRHARVKLLPPLRIDVPAAQYRDQRVAHWEFAMMKERRCQSYGAAGFRDEPGCRQHHAHRCDNLVLGYGHNPIYEDHNMCKIENAKRLRTKPVGDGARCLRSRPFHKRPGVEGLLRIRRQLRFDTPYLDPSVLRRCQLHGSRNAAQQPTTRYWRENHDTAALTQPSGASDRSLRLNQPKLLENLKPAGPLSGNDRRIVIRRNDSVPMRAGEFLRLRPPLRTGRPHQHHLRAHRLRSLALDSRCVVWHHDHGLSSQRPRSVRHTLGVVPARIRNHASP